MSLTNKNKLLDVAVEAAIAASNLIMEALDGPKLLIRKVEQT